MDMKHTVLFCAAMAGAANAGTVIYSNDFSSRTSLASDGPGPWRTYDYAVGRRLAYSFANTSYTYSDNLPWSQPNEMQDGWIHGGAYGYQGDAGGWYPGSYVLTNNEEECPGDTTRRFGSFQLSSATLHTWCRLLQPIGNSFTNGVVRYTVDMRPPKWWGAKRQGSWAPLFRFYPAFRRDLRRPEIGGNAEENPCAIGFTWKNTGTGADTNVLVSGAACNMRHSDQNVFSESNVEPGHWYRCEVKLDVDNKTCSMSMSDMGSAVPSWDTVPGKVVLQTDGDKGWRYPMTAERGPIDGIAFQVEGINSDKVVTNMPCFTNIKVEWKKPGTAAFVSCYENDFTTRRMRTLQPAAPSFAYPEITTRSETVNNPSYWRCWGSNQLPGKDDAGVLVTKPLKGGTALEDVGFDCWRRIYGTCRAYATVANYDGNCVFRVTWPWGPNDKTGLFGCFAQPLGETITSGKVRMIVDLRTPDKFWYTANSGMYACLGDSRHYTSYGENGSMATYVSLAGVGCGGEKLSYPEYKSGDAWPNGKGVYTCAMSHWYRTETIVDLDAKTYDYKLYDLDAPDTPVFTRTGLAFSTKKASPEIAAFSLGAYGPGMDEPGAMLFDNVQIWKNWDAAAGTGDEIYRNDFTRRVRPSVRLAENLGDAPNLTADEKDRWTIRGGGADWARRVSGENGNACANLFVTECATHVMQDFGKVVTKGKLTVTADIRPPNVWHRGDDGREVSVYVGGNEMAQGSMFNGAKIWSAAATLFGFDGGGVAWDATGLCRGLTACVQDGTAIRRFGFTVDPAHWYRFKAKVDMTERKVSVKVYDMGTAHPEMDTPTPTDPVGALDNLAFTNAGVQELTTLCLRGVGLRLDQPWQAEDAGAAFFDNLKAEYDSGMLLLVR